MQPPERERFSAAQARWFHRLIGLAMLAAVASEAVARVDLVHAGVFFPYRHLPGIPLYGRELLGLEWGVTIVVALALIAGWRLALVLRVALAVLVVGLSQRFSNHRALLVLVLAFASLEPADPRASDFETRPWPALALVRYQLVIVYLASAANKLVHGFGDGDVLVRVLSIPPRLARPLALATIALELAVPLLLLLRPRLGIAVVCALHLTFALALPATWSFGFTMVAMALLFDVRRGGSPTPR